MMEKTNRVFEIRFMDYCAVCNKKHVMTMKKCPTCGFYETAQPVSENVHDKVAYVDYSCDGCQAYRDHEY